MSMIKTLFRPGKGRRPGRFIAAVFNAGTAGYRGDVVMWDNTAPTSQGSSGVLEGDTLGVNDFIYVQLTTATIADGQGLQAGILEGTKIGDTDTVTTIPDDSIAIVQTFGVHETVRTVATVVTTSQLSIGTIAGECAETLATDVATSAHIIIGMPMTADSTYTRGTATENKVTGFIRCGG